ncbi:MAG: nuclear transport factor 2 family protein [Gammaproteobacteria bacterium]
MAVILVLTFVAAVASAPGGGDESVRRFMAAFNAQDADAMAELVTPGVDWVTLDGSELRVEVSGRDALRTSMVDYFKSCPSCRSTLVSVSATATRVTTVETASWSTRTGERREQQAIAVYEFDGPLITRVIYFPSEPVGD